MTTDGKLVTKNMVAENIQATGSLDSVGSTTRTVVRGGHMFFEWRNSSQWYDAGTFKADQMSYDGETMPAISIYTPQASGKSVGHLRLCRKSVALGLDVPNGSNAWPGIGSLTFSTSDNRTVTASLSATRVAIGSLYTGSTVNIGSSNATVNLTGQVYVNGRLIS